MAIIVQYVDQCISSVLQGITDHHCFSSCLQVHFMLLIWNHFKYFSTWYYSQLINVHCSLYIGLRGKSVRSWCDGSSDRSFMVDTLSYLSFQPVLHHWCNKGRGMCYSVCGMMHIKEPLLLIGKSSPCGSSGFPLSLSEWSFTICMTPYNRK